MIDRHGFALADIVSRSRCPCASIMTRERKDLESFLQPTCWRSGKAAKADKLKTHGGTMRFADLVAVNTRRMLDSKSNLTTHPAIYPTVLRFSQGSGRCCDSARRERKLVTGASTRAQLRSNQKERVRHVSARAAPAVRDMSPEPRCSALRRKQASSSDRPPPPTGRFIRPPTSLVSADALKSAPAPLR